MTKYGTGPGARLAWRVWCGLALGVVAWGLAGCGSGDTGFGGSVDVDRLGVRDIAVDVTDTTATITWTTRRARASTVTYSTSNALDLSKTGKVTGGKPDTPSGVQHEVQLTGLKADTRYFFRVDGRKTTMRFKTMGGKRLRLAFVSSREDGRREVYLAYENGENVTRVTKTGGWSPALSNDGTRLAWVTWRAGGGTDVWTAQLDANGLVAGSEKALTDSAGRDEASPTFTTDGSAVTCAVQGGLVTVPLDGSAEVPLLTTRYAVNDPSWRRDGGSITFTSTQRSSVIQLSKRPVVDGSISIKVDDDLDTPLAAERWEVVNLNSGVIDMSAAGVGQKRVLVTYQSGTETIENERIAVPTPQACVHVMAPDGSGLRRLTSWENATSGPAYSADGGQIFFVREGDGRSLLYQMSGDGSNVRGLTTGSFVDRDPVVAPDGSVVMFASTRDADGLVNIWGLPSGGEAYPVTLYSTGESEPALSVVP